jgi:hypothetical protein
MKGYKKRGDMQASIVCIVVSARIFVPGNFQAGKRARVEELPDKQHAGISTSYLAFHLP